MEGIPQPYVALSKAVRTTIRLDNVLLETAEELLPVLRPFGFKSDSDIIRTALYQFLERYRSLLDDPSMVDRFHLVQNALHRRQRSLNLEQTFLTTGLMQLQELVNDGMLVEACDLLSELEAAIVALPDTRTRAQITKRLRSNSIVKQLRHE